MLRSLLAKLNKEVLTNFYTCKYLILQLKRFLNIRTPIFSQYPRQRTMLPLKSLICF